MSEELDTDITVLREKQEIIREVLEHLSQITSIGNPTILIEKTKIIVNLSKQLLDGFDELTINKTSNHLTMLVSNAKIIAADPTSVTPEAIRSLTRSRDKLIQQLSQLNIVLEQSAARQAHNSLHDNGSLSNANSKDREKEQLELLARYRGDLRAKKDIQQSFILEGDPATMLEEVVSEFLGSTRSLTKSYEVGSNPSRCEILGSLCGIASSVLRLLDLVDSLFVSKFPMRKQVYSFTEKLLELGMAYKPVERKGGREGDAIRDMRKQLPALNNSAQVMLEQLEDRVRDLTASRHKSMKRRQALSLLGGQELDVTSLAEPHREDTRGTRSLHLRLICHVCCTSAKQSSNGDAIKRGSVLRLEVPGDANIRELKEQLSEYTGIPVKYVLPRFPGVEQPPDNDVELGDLFEGGDIKDVFLFDLSSSEGLAEDELRELRRLAVAQMSIDSYDWDTEWAGDIAQATVDYDVTEPGHLSFIEGELLRVLERKTDGWWRGEVNGVTGIFYRTFVVELERESSTSVPTNFKQVAFIGKPKQSFLARKKSEDIPSPVGKKLSSLRSISRQESSDAQRTSDAKKMSHISISLETETTPGNSTSKQECHPNPAKPEPARVPERSSSYTREKDSSYERKLSNRLNSINIDELIDQLVEYSGIEVPPTPDLPQSSKIISVTNIGFEAQSPNKKDDTTDKLPDFSPATITSMVNPTKNPEEDLYDSLDGVENSTESACTPENTSEENPLYEKVNLECTALPMNKLEQSSEDIPHSDTPSRPPIPTSSRPPKPVPLEQPPSAFVLAPKPKISGKKFRLGGQKAEKPEKDKDKSKSQSKPKRIIFGRRQRLSVDNVLDEPSHISPDAPLPTIPTDTPFNSDNSSTNNSNPVPIGEYSTLQIPDEVKVASSIYEQVDRDTNPMETSSSSQDENMVRPASGNARTSHYEQVDLILPPRASKEQPAVQEEPDKSSADDLYSQVDFVRKNFRKTASVEEQIKPPLFGDELTSSSAEFDTGNETHNVIRSKSNSASDDNPDTIKSHAIYSLVTRKRDSIIIQDDEGDVCVNISPSREHEPAFEPAIENSEPVPKTRPILPPKTLSIEDVEIYIKEDDIGLGEVLLSPVDTFLPACRTSPSCKKRVSHYQDINEPGSPTLPARMLSEDEFYEEVTGRHRASSVPQFSSNSTAEVVKSTLEIRHSAEHTQRKKVTIDQNLTPLPPIPVNTEIQTMDDDLSQYESLETVMGSRAPDKFANQAKTIEDSPLPPAPVDDRSQYIGALLSCVSILLEATNISYLLFAKDNSQHTKKLIKSIEQGQPLDVDYRTPPAILASLIRVILKNGKLGPIFPIAVTDALLVLVKNDKPQPILYEINSLIGLSKFIRDFTYLLYLNFSGLSEKKKLEFITILSALFFEDTSKKNIDNCRHILRFLIEQYPSIFQI